MVCRANASVAFQFQWDLRALTRGIEMKSTFTILALMILTICLSGCASGFRAGGSKMGVEANAGIGPYSASVVEDGYKPDHKH